MASDRHDELPAAQPRNGHLQLALQYTGDSWFPVNPETVSNLSPLLADEKTDNWRARLLREIKGDAALFTATLRDLSIQSSPRSINSLSINSLSVPDNPIELLTQASVQDLRWVLNKSVDKYSRHALNPEEFQSIRLLETVVSAAASETFAESGPEPRSDDADMAFICTQMRQLGLSLVGWNYPHVFRRASGLLKDRQSIDEVIGKILGFTPSQLVVSLARRWGFSARVQRLMENQPDHSDKLSEVLILADKTGRASCRVNYPGQEREWDEVCAWVGSHGGARVWDSLAQRMQEYGRVYAKTLSQFSLPSRILSLVPPATLTDRGLFEKNEYLMLCSKEFQSIMERCYALIKPGGISKQAVDLLCQSLLPRAGFYRGCLFFKDPSSQKLAPRIPIGEARLADYGSFDDASSSTAISGTLAKAVTSPQPYQLESTAPSGEPVICFACRLGDHQYIGGMVLEIRGIATPEQVKSIQVQVKAIRQALHDALEVY